MGDYGYGVVIDHGGGIQRYGHNTQLLVKRRCSQRTSLLQSWLDRPSPGLTWIFRIKYNQKPSIAACCHKEASSISAHLTLDALILKLCE